MYYLTGHDLKDMLNEQQTVINRINENAIGIFKLIPVDGRKSFNGRCKVIETQSKFYLLSYTTIICYFDKNTRKFGKLWNDYSATTMRHINSFMQYLGFSLGGTRIKLGSTGRTENQLLLDR